MPLPYPVKALSVFHDKLYNVGWTESIYILNANDLDQAMVTLRQLETARVFMLGTGVAHEYSSVSQDSVFLLGDVVAKDGLNPNGDGEEIDYNAKFAGKDTDFAWSAVLVRASSSRQYHRSMWLSGAPDDLQLDRDGRIDQQDWLDAFNNWVKILTNGSYGIKVWSKDTTASPIKNITNVAVNGDITLDNAAGLAVGDLVFVHAVQGAPRSSRPHGQYQIKAINGLVVTFQDFTPDASWKYQAAGYLRKRVQIIAPIDDAFQRQIKKKSRGRPLFLERGRSKIRCKR
jgi:hypothetical protein